MASDLRDLYETRSYPAMSHPLSDPAVSAAAALLAGLRTRHPAQARVLEIGCCSGLNLIPLAVRWPRGRFTGIDLSAPAVHLARELAAEAGVSNVEFHTADLRDFEAPAGFDFIIAHGFLSWVPDEVKSALFAFCRRHLAPDGIATVSFNVLAGWRPRFPVIDKARAIQAAGAVDPVTALGVLRSIANPASPELAVIDDMLAKGADILAFDDFGPVNDPWPLDRFVRTAAASGLAWLGESDPAGNQPTGLARDVIVRLRQEAPDPLAFGMAADERGRRTFRSAILCRGDAPIETRFSSGRLLELAVRASPSAPDPDDDVLQRAISRHAPNACPVREVQGDLAPADSAELARRVYLGIRDGWIQPRIEAVSYDPAPPGMPDLGAFRLACAARKLPLVDRWHTPCSFPARHYRVLEAMDGTRTTAALHAHAQATCPELAFGPWLAHLAGRGMFA